MSYRVNSPSGIGDTSTPANNKMEISSSVKRKWGTMRIDRHHPMFDKIQNELIRESSAEFDQTASPEDAHRSSSVGYPLRWCSAPYPPCSENAIRMIQFWWVCFDASNVIGEGAPLSTGDVVGVVGVVLCPFGRGPSGGEVEAYLQVVLVRPSCRRQGVGSFMVKQVLTALALQAHERHISADSSRPILCRVRLHTMSDSASTREYLEKMQRTNTQLGPPVELSTMNDVAEHVRLLRSVRTMYESFGFSIRRNCPRYYVHKADGIEMVLDRERLLRLLEQPTAGASANKRKRDEEGPIFS